MKKQKVLIIGAGPAGLAAAYKLLKDSNKYDVTILEKEKENPGEIFINMNLNTDDAYFRESV